MIGLVQRVLAARVDVDGSCVAKIDSGLLVFVCAEPTDGVQQARRLVDKLLRLRVLADAAGKMNRCLQDTGGGLLLVSQFTLAADTSSGNRPSFTGAANAELGQRLYDEVVALARQLHPTVGAGVFGADMQVHLVNDGPVTIPLRIR